ncbi:MAG TPA: hypothetical protein VES19_03615 [Candidatus Limnocylindrales bacterium]|nr:hypothetical protein [Candidatus Limnocylindrales bacterium]
MMAAPATARHVVVRRSRVRLTWGTVVTGAFVVTLLRPVSWALGLAGFLAGGGILLVAWPILVLPTPTGLQNALGGPVSTLVFGGPSAQLLALIVGGIAGGLALVLAGTLAGAWAERQGIAVVLEAAVDDGLAIPPTDLAGAPGAGRVAVVRLLSLSPVVIAGAAAWKPIYDATYHELILPRDLATPLPLRVLGEVPWLVLALMAVWLLSDAAAAVGVRRLVLERRTVFASWILGWVDLVRRPHRILPTALMGLGVLVLLLGPAMAAAAIGWGRVRDILAGDREPVVVLGALLIWVSIWLGGLVLAGVGAAVRAAAWTLEMPMESAADPTSGAPSPG